MRLLSPHAEALDWDCASCALQAERNCTATTNAEYKLVIRGMVFRRCPKAWLADEASAEMQLVSDALLLQRHRALPRSGGMLDQDPRFIEALHLVDLELSRGVSSSTGQAHQRGVKGP